MKTGYYFCFWMLFAVCNLAAAASATMDEDSAFPPESESGAVKHSTAVIVKKRAAPTQEKGIKAGTFLFIPSVALTEYHDDNIYATETNMKNDDITVISPNFKLVSRWDRHKLDFNAGMDLSRYADFTSENTSDYWLGATGRYDFSAHQNVFGGLNFSREHEDRASPDATAGDTPTRYDDYLAHIGHAYTSGNHRSRIAYTVNRLDFNDVTSPVGVIDNNDRDRVEQALGLRYLYTYSAVMALYLEGVADKREYDITPDYNGNDRNSDGYRYSVGMEYAGAENLLKLFIGRLGRDYQSQFFEDQAELDFGLNYSRTLGPASKFVIQSGRSIEETTFNNSSGYLMTNASLALHLGITTGKSIILNAGKSTADYYGIVRTDDYFDYGLGYNQQLLDNLSLSFELRRSERDSNVAGNDFKINQVFLRISGTI